MGADRSGSVGYSEAGRCDVVTETCPECARRWVQPGDSFRDADTVRYAFDCPQCWHRWVTSYSAAHYAIPNDSIPELWSA